MQRARPPKCIVFVTQPALGVRLCACEGWCSSARTPTSRCVNPAPPVAQSGTACAIHTSSVGLSLLGLSSPSCISHSPSHHICGRQNHNYRSSQGDIVLALYVPSVIQCMPYSKSRAWRSNTSQSLGGFLVSLLVAGPSHTELA